MTSSTSSSSSRASTSSSSRGATPIIVVGARGRMGSRVCALARLDASFEVVRELSRDALAAIAPASSTARDASNAHDSAAIVPGYARVVVDFSSDEGARVAIEVARRAGAALLVGTTALSPETIAMLKAESSQRAVLVAPNTSLGVALLSRLLEHAARALDCGYDVSILESHHAKKKDSPSGTALRLAESVRRGGATVRADQIVAQRGGDVVGEHTVRFAGEGEYLEFTHRATSRDLFARGALRAARWLDGRASGWYSMDDVLGFEAQSR